MSNPLQDLTGRKFGRLTVLQISNKKGKNRSTYFDCLCECGNSTTVLGTNLTRGITRSCGCFRNELSSMRRNPITNDHKTRVRLRNVWSSMHLRCEDPNHKAYSNYGGRGIKVCDEWNDFDEFCKWALRNGFDVNADRMSCTLDRIDNNQGYCPENCRFVDVLMQDNNKRNNKFVTFQGETHTLAEWSRITGINYQTIKWRSLNGKTPSEILKGWEG